MMKKILLTLILFFCFALVVNSESKAQIFSTKLKITVLNELGNVIPGAEVTLFKNKADYLNETNPVQEKAIANRKGFVIFKKLEQDEYFVLASKDDLTNTGGGVIIGNLEKMKMNKANVILTEF